MRTSKQCLRDWWTDNDAICHLMDLTNSLDEQYHDDRVVALGASFGWAIFALGKVREAAGREQNVSVMPFSGGFYVPTKTMDIFMAGNPIELDDPDVQFITEYREALFPFPSEDSLVDLRRQLEKKDLSPKDIIERHEQTGARTIFVDSVLQGRGMISFYSVMHKWAQEDGVLDQLSDAIHFHGYDRLGAFDPRYFQSIEGVDEIKMPISAHHLTEEQEMYLGAMISDNRMGSDSSRIAPYMDVCEHTLGKSPIFPHNEDVWNEIRDTIEAAL
jgi:hypothetical protein